VYLLYGSVCCFEKKKKIIFLFFLSKLCSTDDRIKQDHQFPILCEAQQWELHRINKKNKILSTWLTIDDGDHVQLCIDNKIKQDQQFLILCQAQQWELHRDKTKKILLAWLTVDDGYQVQLVWKKKILVKFATYAAVATRKSNL